MRATTKDAYHLLHRGVEVLSRVEHNGIRIDEDHLNLSLDSLGDQIRNLQHTLRADRTYDLWRREYGEKTNLGSLEQLARILFDVEKHPYCADFTATGRFKADEAIISTVDTPFVKGYLRWTKLRKMRNTFLTGIRRETVDGFLHPVFNLHTVSTFRSSSSDPNFQNFPIRIPEFAEIIRKCFVARPGRVLVEIDYSGIEVRIAACYHKDPVMLEYIKDPTKDMHRDMAAECYLLETKEVSKMSRYCAKNMFVFPQFYGSYYLDCATHLWEAIDKLKLKVEGTDVPLKKHLKSKGIKERGDCDRSASRPRPGTFEDHIRQVEDRFWNERFRVYNDWKKKTWEQYLKDGEFRMLTGFTVQGLMKRNEVLNYGVQGAAFHCLLWSLAHIQDWIVRNKLKTKLVGQIHDSILADVPIRELQDYLTNARRIMTEELPKVWKWINVPLEVEAEVSPEGGSWHEKKEWVERDGVWGPKEKK